MCVNSHKCDFVRCIQGHILQNQLGCSLLWTDNEISLAPRGARGRCVRRRARGKVSHALRRMSGAPGMPSRERNGARRGCTGGRLADKTDALNCNLFISYSFHIAEWDWLKMSGWNKVTVETNYWKDKECYCWIPRTKRENAACGGPDNRGESVWTKGLRARRKGTPQSHGRAGKTTAHALLHPRTRSAAKRALPKFFSAFVPYHWLHYMACRMLQP